jgi:hypothetical protein
VVRDPAMAPISPCVPVVDQCTAFFLRSSPALHLPISSPGRRWIAGHSAKRDAGSAGRSLSWFLKPLKRPTRSIKIQWKKKARDEHGLEGNAEDRCIRPRFICMSHPMNMG